MFSVIIRARRGMHCILACISAYIRRESIYFLFWHECIFFHFWFVSFDPEDAVSIETAQNLIAEKENALKQDLAFIKTNFAFLTTAIEKLQTSGLELNTNMEIYENIRLKLAAMRSRHYLLKFNKIIKRNTNFDRTKIIRDSLYGNTGIASNENSADARFVRKYSPAELAMFKFPPMSSADVERTFSVYKTILTNQRRSFHFNNLKHSMIICCNSHNLQ